MRNLLTLSCLLTLLVAEIATAADRVYVAVGYGGRRMVSNDGVIGKSPPSGRRMAGTTRTT